MMGNKESYLPLSGVADSCFFAQGYRIYRDGYNVITNKAFDNVHTQLLKAFKSGESTCILMYIIIQEEF